MKKLLALLCLLGVITLTACGTNSSNGKGDSEPAVQNKQTNALTNEPSNEQSNEETNHTAKDNAQGDDQDNESLEGKVYEQNLNEPFYYDNKMINNTTKLKIIVSDYEIVSERYAEDRYKEDTDYLKVFIQVENVGEQNSTKNAIDFDHFKAYDENGMEISKQTAFTSLDVRYVEGEFKAADLRPGGKNEGFIYIPIEEGTTPAEMIYSETTTEMLQQFADQFLFKL